MRHAAGLTHREDRVAQFSSRGGLYCHAYSSAAAFAATSQYGTAEEAISMLDKAVAAVLESSMCPRMSVNDP
jgi:hypothetical protein